MSTDPLSPENDLFAAPPRQPDRHDRLIPMINVVFLLLAFFMIAGAIRAADALNVAPPEAQAKGVLGQENIGLLLDQTGQVALDGDILPLQSALDRIEQLIQANPERGLQLKADRNTPSRIILPLLQKLSARGVKQLQLVSIQKRPGK